MADNKKYYYLKLKENFYDSEEMIILQNMQDGYLYSDILMKLYLRSLKNGGKLMFRDLIPYTPSVLAQVVRHQVGTVEKALRILQDLGLIEILDNGAIYMSDIQNFIGESSTEADRIRNYRQKIKKEELACTNVQLMFDKSTPELELEIELEINNKTKLNLLFNYIVKGEKFEELQEADKNNITDIIEKMELTVKPEYLESIPLQILNKTKIKYWVIKELYMSSYKVYLNKITKEMLENKFLKTEKYIDARKIDDFISYYIKSLQNELEK